MRAASGEVEPPGCVGDEGLCDNLFVRAAAAHANDDVALAEFMLGQGAANRVPRAGGIARPAVFEAEVPLKQAIQNEAAALVEPVDRVDHRLHLLLRRAVAARRTHLGLGEH